MRSKLNQVEHIDLEMWGDSAEQIDSYSSKFEFFFDDQLSSQQNYSQNQTLKLQNVQLSVSSFEASLKQLLQTIDQPTNREIKYWFDEKNNQTQKTEQNQDTDHQPKREKMSGVYSKNYRQKKKEKLKSLEEQNLFLKKKIDDLQLRLHQKQMELNRIKFSSHEDFDIQQINEEFMKKLKLISEPDTSASKQNLQNSGPKPQFIPNDKKKGQILNFFELYGIGGKKTVQVLTYQTNQFLENVLRDRQKFYLMKTIKNSYANDKNKVLDLAVKQAFEQTEEEHNNYINHSRQFCRPLLMEMLAGCKEVYNSSKKVINALQKLHEKYKTLISQNVETFRKRLNMAMWFQNNQYRKQMRQLRAEWLDLVKGQEDQKEEQSKIKGKKKIMK